VEGAGALPVQRRLNLEELRRSAVVDRWSLYDKERANVGVQENALDEANISAFEHDPLSHRGVPPSLEKSLQVRKRMFRRRRTLCLWML